MSNSSLIQVANDCEEQVSPLLDIESYSKKRCSGAIGNIDYNNDKFDCNIKCEWSLKWIEAQNDKNWYSVRM